jgi:hypothetical protein
MTIKTSNLPPELNEAPSNELLAVNQMVGALLEIHEKVEGDLKGQGTTPVEGGVVVISRWVLNRQ